MKYDFFDSLRCVLPDENADYRAVLNELKEKDCHIAFMPAIFWYSGIYNLFDQKAKAGGTDMIWMIPAGQADFFWLPSLKKKIVDFYENNEMELDQTVRFPGMEAEEFEECILLHSDSLQDDSEHTILGANVVMIRLSLSSGRDTLLFILLDHQDICWKNIIESYDTALTWFVDSGRGTEDYYARTSLFQLMKHTSHPDTLPAYYFKGLYNKGEVPEGFRFLYAMLSQPEADGYDKWLHFSAVFDTGWKSN